MLVEDHPESLMYLKKASKRENLKFIFAAGGLILGYIGVRHSQELTREAGGERKLSPWLAVGGATFAIPIIALSGQKRKYMYKSIEAYNAF